MDGSYSEDATGGAAPERSEGEAGLFQLAVTRPPAPASPPEIVFGFGKPAPPLAAQLARASLFCVIANPAPLGAPTQSADPERATFGDTLWLGGWLAQARIGPGGSGAGGEGSILILKFCLGSLEGLVGAPTAWADPKTFSTLGPNDDGLSVEKRVRARVAEGIARGDAGESLYQPFAEIARDPSWMGFLILDAGVGRQGLPGPLAILADDPAAGALGFRYLWGGRREPLYANPAGIIDYSGHEEPGTQALPGLSLRRLRIQFDHNYSRAFEAEAALSFAGTAPPLLLALTQQGQARYALAPAAPGETYRLDSDGDPPLPLDTWLERLLDGLWSLQTPDAAAAGPSVTIQVAWRSTLAGGLSTQIPVLRFGPILPRETSPDALAQGLGAAIRSWTAANRPSPQGAALLFDTSFGSTSPDLSLEIPTVVLGLAAVVDTAGDACG